MIEWEKRETTGLRMRGRELREEKTMKEMTLKAVIESIPRITDFVDGEQEALDCPMKEQMEIDVAIDEVFCNIASYAYPSGTGEAQVRFEFDPADRTVTLTFTDQGVPFNPLEKEDPDVTLSAEKRAIGGLGIFLVKKTMDGVEYVRRDGKNILTLRKKI